MYNYTPEEIVDKIMFQNALNFLRISIKRTGIQPVLFYLDIILIM